MRRRKEMYHVIKLYGNFEPWWFLDGWEDDIVSQQAFTDYEEAVGAFQTDVACLSTRFPNKKIKQGSLATFWNEDEQTWCEACDEYVQPYHSLLLLEQLSPARSQDVPFPALLRPCQLKKDTNPQES